MKFGLKPHLSAEKSDTYVLKNGVHNDTSYAHLIEIYNLPIYM